MCRKTAFFCFLSISGIFKNRMNGGTGNLAEMWDLKPSLMSLKLLFWRGKLTRIQIVVFVYIRATAVWNPVHARSPRIEYQPRQRDQLSCAWFSSPTNLWTTAADQRSEANSNCVPLSGEDHKPCWVVKLRLICLYYMGFEYPDSDLFLCNRPSLCTTDCCYGPRHLGKQQNQIKSLFCVNLTDFLSR